jgi:hypothetical protein
MVHRACFAYGSKAMPGFGEKLKPFLFPLVNLPVVLSLALQTLPAKAAPMDAFPVQFPVALPLILPDPGDKLQKEDFPGKERVVVETLLLEAVGEGYEGMLAVGEVIRNRSVLFHKDFEEVCLMPYQFSCWNDRERAKKFLENHKNYYALAEKAWRGSAFTRLVRGATDYHANTLMPDWAGAYQKTAWVGNHIFYKRTSPPD